MPAEGLTKNLPQAKFKQFKATLNLQDIRQAIEETENGKQRIWIEES